MAFGFRLTGLVASLIAVLGGSTVLRAELILDDFDDSASATSPEMEEVFVTTSNVGEAHAVRNIRVIGSAAIPTASLDINISTSSTMTADLVDLNPGAVGVPLFAFQFNYAFAPADFSANGNNAIFFDFLSINGVEGPAYLRVIVADNTDLSETYEQRVYNLPLVSGPFTAVMPFSGFTQRGGASGLPDFATIKRMDFDFFFLLPSNDVRWSAELDRIRMGRIPEPASASLCLFAMSMAALVGRRQMSVVTHSEGHGDEERFRHEDRRLYD